METYHDILDAQILEDLILISEDEPEFLRNLVQHFFKQSHQIKLEINQCVQTGQLERAGRLTHKLLGASSSLGALKLIEILEALQQKLDTQHPITPDDLNQLHQIIQQTRQAMVRFFLNTRQEHLVEQPIPTPHSES